MEKSEAIGLYTQSEALIKRLKDLLKEEDSQPYFNGLYIPKLFNIAEDLDKVSNYVIDGGEGAEKLYTELLTLKGITKELQEEASQKCHTAFASNCDPIISIIEYCERWFEKPSSANNQSVGHKTSNTGNGEISQNQPKLSREDVTRSIEEKILSKQEKIPVHILDCFGNKEEYASFIKDCQNLKTTKQVIMRYLEVSGVDQKHGDLTTLHEHLVDKNIINVGYSAFVKAFKKENSA